MTLPDTRYDLIVVGSGVAGLYTAIRAAERARVLLVTKSALEESNTRYAQGGIAVALGENDSPDLHMRDTIAAGDGLCDPAAVGALTRDAPARILELLASGVPFDREGGDLAWTLEAAHSRPRVLHAGGDATGRSIETTLTRLARASGMDILEETSCVDLVMWGGRVSGLKVLLPDGREQQILAGAVVLATGGAGQLFSRTTNPTIATGDGAAIAFRAGAELMDPEFIQFHPTAIALPGVPSFLISEAVRGEGGILRDRFGHAFMAEYHVDRELAPRDVVARAIHSHMQRTDSPHAWLDITHLDQTLIERRFPSIVAFCRGVGIDPVHEAIPVAPAAHYWMGGIRTDLDGRTSLSGLFAAGEAACTGVHGANRLASNSLLEGLVFAARVVDALTGNERERSLPDVSLVASAPGIQMDAPDRVTLATAMWRDASLVRSAHSLHSAEQTIMGSRVEGLDARRHLEARNLGQVARVVLAAAVTREESRGAHFRGDYPFRDARWQSHTVVSRAGIGLVSAPVLSHV